MQTTKDYRAEHDKMNIFPLISNDAAQRASHHVITTSARVSIYHSIKHTKFISNEIGKMQFKQ